MKYATIYYNDQGVLKIKVTRAEKDENQTILYIEKKAVAIVPNNYLIIFSDER
jgi:hypothetical protein